MILSRTRKLAGPIVLLIALAAMSAGVQPAAGATPAAASPSKLGAPHAGTLRAGFNGSGPQKEVFGFAPYWTLSQHATWNYRLLSTVAYFALAVRWDGTWDTATGGWAGLHSQNFADMVSEAHHAGARVVLTIKAEGEAPLNDVLTVQAETTLVINNVVSAIGFYGLDGVNVDFEGYTTPGYPNIQAGMTRFMTQMSSAVHQHFPGSFVSIATYSGAASWDGGLFKIGDLAPVVDAFFIMAYDMSFSNMSGQAGPNAPLNGWTYNDTLSISQYLTKAPASKIILGVPWYGYRFTTSSNAPYATTSSAVADSYAQDVSDLACARNVTRSWDSPSSTPWAAWYSPKTGDPCGINAGAWQELYYDNPQSLGLKYDLINRTGIRGVGIWALGFDSGAPELWNGLATHFTLIPGLAGYVNACAGNTTATVSWTAAPTAGGAISSYTVTADPGGASVTVPGSATFATVTGLTAGTQYTFSVVGTNANGYGAVSTSGPVTPVATDPVSTRYFSWYDNVSKGMLGDNIHLLDTGTDAVSGCVTVSGKAVMPFSLVAGQEQHLSFHPGTTGGPVVVTVNTGTSLLASQRVQFFNSFNEIYGLSPAQADTTVYLSWFDRATPGMVADNIHVINPGAVDASVVVSLPGASPQSFALAAGAEHIATFPVGHLGGPVTVTADQPVLATQRVQYYRSFNETAARGAAAASQVSYLQWFDRASPGMVGDNIHVLNPGTTPAHVQVSLGASTIPLTLAAGQEGHVTFPVRRIGGPVKVSADVNVLAWQRVQYYQSFNEVASATEAQALMTSYVMWFDRATPGMVGDNIHVLNPGATAATVTVDLAGILHVTVTVAPGAEVHVTFPVRRIGGPITITSDQPVLGAQRVQYYQSFNEVPSD